MESTVDIGGVAYTLASDDSYLANMGASFEPETVKLLKTLAYGIALDVGANIGCTALAMAQVCDTVHAFEPSPSTHHFLVMNTRSSPNISTHNVGLGAKEGRSQLTFSPTDRSGGFVSSQTQASAGHTVESITIKTMDQMVRSLGLSSVDFVKMDVEGFEASVIRGAPETLWRFHPTVTMEMNHWCLNAFQRTSIPDFLDMMRAVFPVLYAVQGDTYVDLRDPDRSYVVMYRHILHGHYATLLGAFDLSRVSNFTSRYAEGIAG